MAWYRGIQLLTETRTGAAMVGSALTSSAAVTLVLHRRLGTGRSLAAGGSLALAQLGAIAWFGHRLVRAGEKLADEFVSEVAPQTEPAGEPAARA